MTLTTARDTRFRNNGNQVSGWNLYNESQVHFSWEHSGNLVRKPSPILILDYIGIQQYNTAAAFSDHYQKKWMDHEDYWERIWEKSDQLNTTVSVGIRKTVSLNTHYLVPNGRTAPSAIDYTIVDEAVPGASTEAELTAWSTAVIDAMDVKPEMIVLITNGFVGIAGTGYSYYFYSLEADKRYILFTLCVIPYTTPNTQYWIQDITRTLEITNGIISMDFGDT